MKRKNKNPMVTLWDGSSNTFTQIPKSELAPGMVQCKIQGRSGLVWREATSVDLKKTPYRHPPFEGNLRLLIGSLSISFVGAYEHSYEFWEDGFRRDTNPHSEMYIWIVAADVYRQFAEGRSLPYRKELFRLLAVCNVTPKDILPMVFEKNLLSADEVDSIAAAYYGHLAK